MTEKGGKGGKDGWDPGPGSSRSRTVLAAFAAVATFAALPATAQSVGAILASPPANRALWGIALTDDRGRLLYELNANRFFIPASVAKLVVASTALVMLPADRTVTTSVYGSGPTSDGVLRGNLVLYGRGDPTFTARCYAADSTLPGACDTDPSRSLRRLAGQLRARGLTRVDGDLIGDGSYFEPTLVHPKWENYDLNWWYAAPVSGLGYKDNAVDLHWQPAGVGQPVEISISPDFAGVQLDNRSRTGPPGSEKDLDFFREPGTLKVWAQGRLPADHAATTEYFAIPDPNLYAAQAFRAVLADSGITVAGPVRSTTDSMFGPELRRSTPLASVESRPMREWLFPILNSSQNWFAEMLLKQLGRQLGGEGSWAAGIEVERRFLVDSVGLAPDEFKLVDGSGLAASTYLTPRALARLLGYMRRERAFGTLAAALPVAGGPGSLRNRFAGTPLEGRVRAKTGSIGGVNVLAGYLELGNRTLTVVVAANHHNAPWRRMVATIDSAVVALAREFGEAR